MIEFSAQPESYRHWRLEIDGSVAFLNLNVQEDGGLLPGYKLKLNSYDLGVDIELNDAVQRLRFEHPEVRAVVIRSDMDDVFCAGANIQMLGQSSHAHKVNFCKFTNETRNAIEDASRNSGQTYLCAINGAAAGGGYELALAAEHIILVDDGKSAVSLPEAPLLAVLPGTGGLTRVVDKRYVRRDHADVFCTLTEGIKGKRALDWRLVDEVAPRSRLDQIVRERAQAFADKSDRPDGAAGIKLSPLNCKREKDSIDYDNVRVMIDRAGRAARIVIQAPRDDPPGDLAGVHAAGAAFWPLALARELDDAILHLRFNEPDIGAWVLTTSGDAARVMAADAVLQQNAEDWLVREITLYLKRVLKRLDVSSRSLVTLIELGGCFAGFLVEFVLAADRSYMLDGVIEGDNRPPVRLRLSEMNFGPLTMCNGLTRLETRFLDNAERVAALREMIDCDLDAATAEELGLVTFIPDDIDWEDEVRLALEERASLSPDALTGMEASLRFAGPETLETKIFGRLSAWQNWIFQRPNAVGEEGALKRFGSGVQPKFDRRRV
ncbi:MAG: 2,3-epoxybenzoyl-CoA dihydrolase [Parvularculaceae bacterium]